MDLQNNKPTKLKGMIAIIAYDNLAGFYQMVVNYMQQVIFKRETVAYFSNFHRFV